MLNRDAVPVFMNSMERNFEYPGMIYLTFSCVFSIWFILGLLGKMIRTLANLLVTDEEQARAIMIKDKSLAFVEKAKDRFL